MYWLIIGSIFSYYYYYFAPLSRPLHLGSRNYISPLQKIFSPISLKVNKNLLTFSPPYELGPTHQHSPPNESQQQHL